MRTKKKSKISTCSEWGWDYPFFGAYRYEGLTVIAKVRRRRPNCVLPKLFQLRRLDPAFLVLHGPWSWREFEERPSVRRYGAIVIKLFTNSELKRSVGMVQWRHAKVKACLGATL